MAEVKKSGLSDADLRARYEKSLARRMARKGKKRNVDGLPPVTIDSIGELLGCRKKIARMVSVLRQGGKVPAKAIASVSYTLSAIDPEVVG